MRLSFQTRVDISSRAEVYIAGLVASCHGDGEDVRWIIGDLRHWDALGRRDNASEHGSRPAPEVFRWQGEVSSP